jgi:hypothetical protein
VSVDTAESSATPSTVTEYNDIPYIPLPSGPFPAPYHLGNHPADIAMLLFDIIPNQGLSGSLLCIMSSI